MTTAPTPSPVFTPFQLGPVRLRNRVVKVATFEGMSPDGVPSDRLVDFHRAVAAGGAALSTVAYCSVSPRGRSYATQMWMRREILPTLRRLVDAVHAEGAAAAIQLGHCGLFANKHVIGGRPLAPSVVWNTYGLCFARAMTPADIEDVVDAFGAASALAVEAGFDALEIHVGHGYLLSQFLSPATNRRRDAWGGVIENRLRLPAAVLRRVRDVAGTRAAVVAKTNLTDGFPGGLTVAESADVARRFERDGTVDALALSGGFVSRTPLYMLRGDVPLRAMVSVQPNLGRKIGLALFGRLFVPHHRYEEAFFLEPARRVRAAVRTPLVLMGGLKDLGTMEGAVREGFELVGLGRALVHDPGLVRKLERGATRRSDCVPCNECIAEMDRGGTRCTRTGPARG